MHSKCREQLKSRGGDHAECGECDQRRTLGFDKVRRDGRIYLIYRNVYTLYSMLVRALNFELGNEFGTNPGLRTTR